MAGNVFGSAVTDETVRTLPPYVEKDVITQADRAHVALKFFKNADSRADNAVNFVENLKARYGNGVSTLSLVYNATGNTLSYVNSHDWYGHIGESPYPTDLQNGQWGAYLHVHEQGVPSGSFAAVVYRGVNAAGKECDWMYCWSNPWDRWFYNNTVYTEIREAHHYEKDYWGYIYDKLKDSGLKNDDTWNGCYSTVTTGSDTSPKLEAILTLEGVKSIFHGKNYST